MKKVDQIAELLRCKLPSSFVRVGDMVFNDKYEFVIKGLMVERTAYKDTYYAKTQILTFFTFHKSTPLSHSDLLHNTTPKAAVDAFIGSPRDVAEQLLHSIIEANLIGKLQQAYTLTDFLSAYGNLDDDGGSSYNLIDIACASALIGDFERAKRCFLIQQRAHEQCVACHTNTVPDFEFRLYDQVTASLDALAKGPGHLREHIIAAVTRNARHLGFEPVGPAQSQISSPHR